MTSRRANSWSNAGRFAAQAFETFMLIAIGAFWGVALAVHFWGR